MAHPGWAFLLRPGRRDQAGSVHTVRRYGMARKRIVQAVRKQRSWFVIRRRTEPQLRYRLAMMSRQLDVLHVVFHRFRFPCRSGAPARTRCRAGRPCIGRRSEPFGQRFPARIDRPCRANAARVGRHGKHRPLASREQRGARRAPGPPCQRRGVGRRREPCVRASFRRTRTDGTGQCRRQVHAAAAV